MRRGDFIGLRQGTLNQVERLIEMARHHSKRVLIDPKGQDFTKYRGQPITPT